MATTQLSASATKHSIESLNTLLRGELSATETYQQAIQKLGGRLGTAELYRISAEHFDAVNMLREHILDLGGEPTRSSGAWGTFAKAVEGTAAVLGNKTALRALKTGEESGISSYEKSLRDGELPAHCIDMIRSRLLPQTEDHVQRLQELIDLHN